MDRNLMAICGQYCGECDWKDKVNCQGCKSNQSKMFWGECEKAKCCIEKGYEHCGLCPELPCQKMIDLFNDQEHGDNGERLRNLKNWANQQYTYERLR